MNVFAALKKVLGLQPKDDLPAPPMVLTERIECSVSPTPVHDIKLVIVDNVVKSIWSPCDRVSALAASQLGGKSCARRYEEIRAWLLGTPKGWNDIIDSRDPLDHPIQEAQRRRLERKQRRALPASERTQPRIWERFIQHTTGLVARISVYGESQILARTPNARVYVETPDVESFYSFMGGGWALGQGPGDQRVYDLLNKHVKLNSKLLVVDT